MQCSSGEGRWCGPKRLRRLFVRVRLISFSPSFKKEEMSASYGAFYKGFDFCSVHGESDGVKSLLHRAEKI